ESLDYSKHRDALSVVKRHRLHTREIGGAPGQAGLAEPAPTGDGTGDRNQESPALYFTRGERAGPRFPAVSATAIIDPKFANAVAKQRRNGRVAGFVPCSYQSLIYHLSDLAPRRNQVAVGATEKRRIIIRIGAQRRLRRKHGFDLVLVKVLFPKQFIGQPQNRRPILFDEKLGLDLDPAVEPT